jgi:hypothetical protein
MAKSVIRNYSLTIEQAFTKAQTAVEKLGYKITNADRAKGLIQFKTPMSLFSWAGQDMSIAIKDNGNGTTIVDISGVRNTSGFMQVYDWGEPGMIAKKVFSWMEKDKE